MSPYAIFDLDGCLADDRARLVLIDHSQPDPWAAYHAKCNMDRLMNAKLLALAKNYELIIFTARPESARERTQHWLKIVAKVEPRHIFMRPEGCRKSSPELKHEFLLRLFSVNIAPAEIAFAVDDRIDVLDVYAKYGIPAIRTFYQEE